MTSKSSQEEHSQEIFQIIFQIFVSNQKVQGKKTSITFLKHFLNAMIKNIKIHKFTNIIEISKSMEPNKCIQNKFMNMFIQVFPMIFQSSMGLGKLRCDVFSGTIEGWACLDLFHILSKYFNFL